MWAKGPTLNNTNSPQTQPCPPTFETALLELEGIVHQLEDGELGLEEALARYEQGVALLKHCYGVLQRSERKIELLSGVDADGNPIVESFSDEATFNHADPAPAKPKRRTAGVKNAASQRPVSTEPPEGCVDDSTRLF
jgi:exodeoxyribonuclease VII small subunit